MDFVFHRAGGVNWVNWVNWVNKGAEKEGLKDERRTFNIERPGKRRLRHRMKNKKQNSEDGRQKTEVRGQGRTVVRGRESGVG
jgi:hypothetical protein